MPIALQPEPPDFYQKVQSKGERFLANNPNARGSKLKNYWREIIPELRVAYAGICAYTCHWIAPDTGSSTVDHFMAKDKYPLLAYHWDNYRLVCGNMNGRKGAAEDVLDPFTLADGWFVMHFPSLQLKPGKELAAEDAARVIATIKRLRLNDDMCVGSRMSWLKPYLQGEYGMRYLEGRAPFLASELKRQDLQDIALPIWDRFKQ